MKKLILLLHFTFGVFCFTFSQTAPGIEWQNTIGGSSRDELRSINQTSDGGYILGGSSKSGISADKTEINIGDWDYWLVKLDILGNIQWQNTIGGGDYDYLYSIEQTFDGGYILGGISSSNISGDKTENRMGNGDYWIIKTDSLGNIIWQNTIGGSKNEFSCSVKQTVDGGYFIYGISDSDISGDKTENCIGLPDFWILKIDSTGNILWQNTIGGSFSEEFIAAQEVSGDGYILSGISYSNSHGFSDYSVIKIDSLGSVQWQNTIGGINYDESYSILQTSDGGYMVGGYSNSNISGNKTDSSNGFYDYWIIKLSPSGNILWQNSIGGSYDDKLFSVQNTNDGGYILGGYSVSNISGDKTENCISHSDYWIVKTDSLGNVKWDNTIGGTEGDYLYSIENTNDGGFILGGYSDSDISGDKTENCIGQYDYWIIKLYPDTTTGISNNQPSTNTIQLFPNPTKDEITITGYTLQNNKPAQLKIFDVMSKQVLIQSITNLNSQIVNLKSFTNGVYFMQLQSGSKVSRAKFVKQ